MTGVSDDELYRQYETVNIYRRGPGAKIEFNRPDRLNAWNSQFSTDLIAAITEVTDDADVRAVVLTGAGRAFSSGADLKAASGGCPSRSSPRSTARRPGSGCLSRWPATWWSRPNRPSSSSPSSTSGWSPTAARRSW